jgi:polygalacturonase
MSRLIPQACVGLAVSFAWAGLLDAQDSRRVSEPSLPASCVVLEARLAAPAGVLSDQGEKSPDTSRIQAAIDGCTPGRAVVLTRSADKDVFLTGPLRLRPGVTLVVGERTALFASRDPRDYDVEPGSCGVLRPVDKRGPGCRPLLLAEDAPGAAVMGPGAIDGRGGAKMAGDDRSWWQIASQAKVFDLQQSCPRLLVVRRSNGFVLYRITLRNSPNFHVVAEQTDGFTAWGVRIRTPKTARNTDGIDPSSSTNVTIAHSFIDTGDDDVAIKSGPAGKAAQITIAHNHFYSGHGMSIGSGTSGGVSAVRVSDLTIDGADNGLRIKSDRSRGGLVEDVSYEDVCLRDVANPIVLTTMYTTFPGDRPPVYRKIRLTDVRSLTRGRSTILGLPEQRIDVTLDNVSVDGQRPDELSAEHADVRIGPRRGSFLPSGATVSVDDAGAVTAEPPRCEGRFTPFPEDAETPVAAVTVPPEDRTLYVAADGTGDYYSIQRAIDVAPDTGATISVAPGIYRERLTIAKPGIRLQSPYEDASRTVVVSDASASTAGGTLKSATVAVRASDFVALNLTFANDWNASHPQLAQGSQAVALLVTGDRALFRNVRILGNQDTLYVGSTNCEGPDGIRCTAARAYFERCLVQGNVDFVFGDGRAWFERCEIRSTPHEIGFLTAHGRRDEAQAGAFVLRRCRLTAEPGVDHVWLGRPWRERARVVFLDTEMGAHIEPAGWREWHPGETNRLDTSFFAERGSTGAGARAEGREPRARMLSAQEAEPFELPPFLAGEDGWQPQLP